MDKYLQTVTALSPVEVALAAFTMLAASIIWYGALFRRSYAAQMQRQGNQPVDRPGMVMLIKVFALNILVCLLIGLIDAHANGNAIAIFVSLLLVWVFVALHTAQAMIWEKMPLLLYLLHVCASLLQYLLAGGVFWIL